MGPAAPLACLYNPLQLLLVFILGSCSCSGHEESARCREGVSRTRAVAVCACEWSTERCMECVVLRCIQSKGLIFFFGVYDQRRAFSGGLAPSPLPSTNTCKRPKASRLAERRKHSAS